MHNQLSHICLIYEKIIVFYWKNNFIDWSFTEKINEIDEKCAIVLRRNEISLFLTNWKKRTKTVVLNHDERTKFKNPIAPISTGRGGEGIWRFDSNVCETYITYFLKYKLCHSLIQGVPRNTKVLNVFFHNLLSSLIQKRIVTNKTWQPFYRKLISK